MAELVAATHPSHQPDLAGVLEEVDRAPRKEVLAGSPSSRLVLEQQVPATLVQPAGQSADQSESQPPDQSEDQPEDQPVGQAADRAADQAGDQPAD